MKDYIIRAEYGSQMPYYIGFSEKRNIVFMEKLRPQDILDKDFGYTLEEAQEILKMYKAHRKNKLKDTAKYNKIILEYGLRPFYGTDYIAKNYYICKKSKLKNHIERKRLPNGDFGYMWKTI